MTTTNLASFRAGMLMCASLISLLAESTAGAEREPRTAEYGRIPLHFEANRGQADHSIDYVARGPGYALSLQAKQASLQLRSGENSSLLRMRVVGANAAAEPQGAEELEGKVNYFIGSDPAHWRQDVPTYGRVRYRHVYRGIDLVYYGNQRQLEYDFIVAPGADWRRIQLLFEGADNLEIEAATGDLLLHVGDGIVRQPKPTVYQEINGERRPVEGSYRLRQGNRVGFAIGEYDRNLPLIIDPVLVYSTYLGGSGTDDGNDIKVDSAGNAYICGNTSSTNFPTANAIQATFGGATFAGGRDAFVTKINADGTGFVYSTYLGGSGDDRANKIAVDSAGNAYVAGETTSSSNFPRVNALQSNFGGGLSDAFITKLNADGSAIVYSTYLGGSVFDAASGIAIDSSRNAYITGRTTSANFPTANAIQATQASANADAFVTKINAEGSALVYSTYLGGSGGEAFDAGFSIAVDSVGAAYVTGQTTSTGFPTVNPVQANFGGGSPDGDAFVTKINADGMSLAYSTYLGGGANDVGFEITVDSAGSAYVAGVARSANFPTANAYQAMLNGASDAFVTKFAPAGSALVYSTYFGGSSEDSGNGIVANSDGEVYLAGGTSSADLPTANPTQAMTGGGIDGFVTHFNADGSALVYSSYLGGSGADTILAIALDTDLGMYVTGRTASSDFQTLSPIQTSNGGGQDAFVAKLSVDPPPTPTPTPTPIVTPTPNPTPSATPTPTPVPPQLLNISTRLRVGTGANALFGGFIITGSDSKRVIIRAIGPSLAEQGVAGVLEDPTLELFDGAGESIAFNDNWKDDQQADIEGSTIAPNDDLEAAIVRTLQPGNYTAIVRGSGDTTGIGLVEIYDLAAGTQTKLANISSRGFVEIGENVLIGGFIVRGESGTTRVVLRAIGPSLGEQGVEGALQDPALQLVDENGSEIAVNDDWKSGSQQAELEALHIAPANDLEAALIATLGNGNYTAIVSGRSDSTGVGLVEVYNVP